jgi:Glycosyltransferase sugar-binding region containing DXD motif
MANYLARLYNNLKNTIKPINYPIIFNVNKVDESEYSRRALLIYIVRAFLQWDDSSGHQNRRQSRHIVKLLDELGYIVDVADIRDKEFRSDKDYDLVISNRVINTPLKKDALQIYLATTLYHLAHNKNILNWYGTFSWKQAFAIKSFLATQDLDNSELWLWLDAESGYTDYQKNPYLQPLLPFLHVKRFDPEVEARNTPLELRSDLYQSVSPAARSDFFRFVVLYNYGGFYADMDTMFLRSMNTLLHKEHFYGEFCYRWSAHTTYGSSAILRLRQRSETAHALLA